MPKKRKQSDLSNFTVENIIEQPFQLTELQKHELQKICDHYHWDYATDDTIMNLLQLIFVKAKQHHKHNELKNHKDPKNIDALPVFPFDMHAAREHFEKINPKKDGYIRSGIITAEEATFLDGTAKRVFAKEQNKLKTEFEARCTQVGSNPFFQKLKAIEKEVFTVEEIQKLRPENFDFNSWYVVDWLTKSATFSTLNPNPLDLSHLEVWWDINLFSSLIDACFLDCYKVLNIHRHVKRSKASSKMITEGHGIHGIFEIRDGPEIGIIESSSPHDTKHIEQDQLEIAKRLKDFLDHAFNTIGTPALRYPFFGIQTVGTQVNIFQLARSFSNAYVFVCLSSITIPNNTEHDVESLITAAQHMLALKQWILEFCSLPFKPISTSDSSSAIPSILIVETASTPVKPPEKRRVAKTDGMAKTLTITSEERHPNSFIWYATTKEGDHVVIKRTNEEMGIAELRGLCEIQSNYVVEPLSYWIANDMYHIVLPRLHPIEWDNPSDREVKIVIFQLLLALRDIHAAGLVHLDITCNNIMRNPHTQKINVIDFGLSMPISRTTPYPIVGTEEMDEGEAVGTATDVFAAGIVFAVLLSHNDSWKHLRVLREYDWGKFLLSTQSLYEIHNKLRFDSYQISNCSVIPHNAMQLLLSMLEPSPEDRITVDAALQHPYFRQP